MGNKEKPYLVFLISAILFLSFSTLISSGAPASTVQSNPLTINETQITTNASDQYYPDVYDDTIVWQDERNGKWDMYMYNLSTSRETSIPINGTMPCRPVIYGDRIVWGDSIFTSADSNESSYLFPVIYMYDLSTSKQTQISGNQAAMSPAIYGDRIVWMDSRNSGKWDYLDSTVNWNIYMYNIPTSKETQLFSNKSMKMFPAIYKDKIVWMDSRNGGSGNYWNLTGNWDIYMYDFSTQKETQITTDASAQLYLDIYGNRIVWLDARNESRGIYGYDLSTSKEIFISNVRSLYEHPAIYGNRVVWADWRGGKPDIYMYDLITSRETQITTNESRQEYPAIFGNRIVWQDERNGNKDIYMCTVSGEDAESDTEQKVESGEIRALKVKALQILRLFLVSSVFFGCSSIREDRR